MSPTQLSHWEELVRRAFPSQHLYDASQELSERIFRAAAAEPTHLPGLFADISTKILSIQGHVVSVQPQAPSNKRRKVWHPEEENGAEENGTAALASRSQPPMPFFECTDVSVQAPLRKKLRVALGSAGAKSEYSQITLYNSTTDEVEYGLHAIEVDQVFCLPMPDKQARQQNFVVFPKNGALDTLGRPAEQVLMVMNETSPTGITVKYDSKQDDDTYVTMTERALTSWLRPVDKSIIKPTANEFASSIPQSHRKGEKAYHVKAHKGSKEGYLFFLENGIVFGFKKPLTFFPFSSIESISYTSVLQRTFNLVIAALGPDETEAKETEFSMIDQEDFAGIDEYIKRHALNDASMAAQRRAKAYNVNKDKKADANGEVADGMEQEDEQSELQKAEQQLQDEEDELEEDYEASGGESEGEGESSEEGEEYADEEIEEVEAEDDEAGEE